MKDIVLSLAQIRIIQPILEAKEIPFELTFWPVPKEYSLSFVTLQEPKLSYEPADLVQQVLQFLKSAGL